MKLRQGSPEWHKWRNEGIGASDSPIIMGVSPWRKSHQLWEEKVGLRDSTFMSAAMQRGMDLEPVARKEFNFMTGIVMEEDCFIHPTLSWMRASMDGISKDKKYAVEIKCPGEKAHKMALDGIVPEYYYPQLQHQIEVCGLDMIYYFSFDGERGKILEVGRDQAYIDKMIQEEEKFFECMTKFIPPYTPYVEKNSEDFKNLLFAYENSIAMRKKYEESEDEAKQELIKLAEGENCRGFGYRLTKEVRRGQIDYKLIPELGGLNLDQYRKKPVEYWKITQEKK